jgi:predicted NBD/HSP70 family sugar kinase
MYLVFDIGGTSTRIGVSSDGTQLDRTRVLPTPSSFEQGLDMIDDVAGTLAGQASILAAGGGLAGPLNSQKTHLVNSPNLPGWVGQPFTAMLGDRLGAPVFLENDAALVGMGEAMFGAGRDHRIVAYVTVSTGLGGCRIVDGRIDVSAQGFEPGHQIIDHGKTVEMLVSGSGLLAQYGKRPEEIRDAKIWDTTARYLAYGLNNIIVHWSPHIVVVGGSVMKTLSLDQVRDYLRNILSIFPTIPPLVPAQLGDIGGLYGGLALLRTQEFISNLSATIEA